MSGCNMENIKVLNGQWHVRAGKKWHMRSNFVFEILYEVAHPQDSIYVVDVTTDSGQKGEAFFKAGDLHNPKDFQTALNRTFKVGTLLCHFKQVELLQLVAQMASEARRRTQAVTYRRKMVTNAGRQEGTSIVFLSPTQIMDISTGAMIHPMDSPFIWLKGDVCNLKGPKMDLAHRISTPVSLKPLGTFMGKAEAILQGNIAPAILAWSAMYGLNFYQKWIATNRHYNLPVLYGPPTAGKTLIAQCAAWMNGCSELHIASRCTLAFVTSWLTTSSLPFVWDDPTSSEEVAQLAVDLGNGAVRGKANDDTKKPLTGCLVTANFDLSAAYKYFSRLLVLQVSTVKTKKTGDARVLEDAAKAASSALPLVLSLMDGLSPNDIQKEVEKFKNLDMDIRIVEGIALSTLLARLFLNAAGRYDLMGRVTAYVEKELTPYYRSIIHPTCNNTATKDGPSAEVIDAVLNICLSQDKKDVTTICNNNIAIKADRMKSKELRNNVIKLGGRTNHSVRLKGKSVKCVTLPKNAFSEEDWQKMAFAISEDEILPVIAAEAAEAENHQPAEDEILPVIAAVAVEAAENHQPAEDEILPVIAVEATEAENHQPAEDEILPVIAVEATEAENHQPAEDEILPVIAVEATEAENHQPAEDEILPVIAVEATEAENHQPAEDEILPVIAAVAVEAAENHQPAEDEILPVIAAEAVEATNNKPTKTVHKLPFPVVKRQLEILITCEKCKKVGSKYLHWIACDGCGLWWHRKCTTLTSKDYLKLKEDSVWKCINC